jgi:hypothetical protein
VVPVTFGHVHPAGDLRTHASAVLEELLARPAPSRPALLPPPPEAHGGSLADRDLDPANGEAAVELPAQRAFEDQAERESIRFVATDVALERELFTRQLADRWDQPVTVADVLRQIGHDERMHRLDSEHAAHDAGVARWGGRHRETS